MATQSHEFEDGSVLFVNEHNTALVRDDGDRLATFVVRGSAVRAFDEFRDDLEAALRERTPRPRIPFLSRMVARLTGGGSSTHIDPVRDVEPPGLLVRHITYPETAEAITRRTRDRIEYLIDTGWVETARMEVYSVGYWAHWNAQGVDDRAPTPVAARTGRGR